MCVALCDENLVDHLCKGRGGFYVTDFSVGFFFWLYQGKLQGSFSSLHSCIILSHFPGTSSYAAWVDHYKLDHPSLIVLALLEISSFSCREILFLLITS